MTRAEAKQFVDGLNKFDKYTIYHALMAEEVEQDILDYLKSEHYNLDVPWLNDLIDTCVDDYVYNCKYNDNLSYWDNIKNLVEPKYEKYEKECEQYEN